MKEKIVLWRITTIVSNCEQFYLHFCPAVYSIQTPELRWTHRSTATATASAVPKECELQRSAALLPAATATPPAATAEAAEATDAQQTAAPAAADAAGAAAAAARAEEAVCTVRAAPPSRFAAAATAQLRLSELHLRPRAAMTKGPQRGIQEVQVD